MRMRQKSDRHAFVMPSPLMLMPAYAYASFYAICLISPLSLFSDYATIRHMPLLLPSLQMLISRYAVAACLILLLRAADAAIYRRCLAITRRSPLRLCRYFDALFRLRQRPDAAPMPRYAGVR